jgi:hypothetical protein
MNSRILLTDDPIGQVAVQKFNASDMASPSLSTQEHIHHSRALADMNKKNAQFWNRSR